MDIYGEMQEAAEPCIGIRPNIWQVTVNCQHLLNRSKVHTRFKTFTAMKIQVVAFWVVTLYCVVVGDQRFRDPCCLQLQGGNVDL